jgi:Rrf2 family protein
VRISIKSEYGLRAVMELAAGYGGRYIPTAEIAARRDIPEPFLERLLPTLRKAGIVVSLRGPQGGHALAVHPSRVTVGDVVRALEGPLVLIDCSGAGEHCKMEDGCVLQEVWRAVSAAMEAVMDRTTIEELVQRESTRKGATMYYI